MENMTSLQRVLTTLGHNEPDRIPFFLLATMHGAKELGISIKEYFSNEENVALGQLKMRKKYKHDCLCSFFYAPLEIEAWGGDVIFSTNGPPNSGTPFIKNKDQIRELSIPIIENTPCLTKVLRCTEILKKEAGDEVPIIGVVMSPFSLPVMQLGFDAYLDIMHEEPELFEILMKVNTEFSVSWANAQIAAGATAIGYFDPVSSSSIIPRKKFLETGYKIAKETISRFNGPAAIHLASARALPIIDDLAETGAAVLGTSVLEDLAEIKNKCKNKLTVLGNLNGIQMCRWTPLEAEEAVKEAINKAGKGGGYILSDNHGEIPYQVPEEILLAISNAVYKWGKYPLD